MLGNFQHPPGSGRLRSFIASVAGLSQQQIGRRPVFGGLINEYVRVA
jgi:hypothetical protein